MMLTVDSPLASVQAINSKMASESIFTLNQEKMTTIPLSSEEKMKIDDFISQLEHKPSDKDFFAFIFKTMVNLNKEEKEKFITGAAQTLKSYPDENSPSLYEKFTKALKRYQSVILMSSPLSEQLNRNISQIKLEPDDDDDDDMDII